MARELARHRLACGRGGLLEKKDIAPNDITDFRMYDVSMVVYLHVYLCMNVGSCHFSFRFSIQWCIGEA